jgi:hypothetical protein
MSPVVVPVAEVEHSSGPGWKPPAWGLTADRPLKVRSLLNRRMNRTLTWLIWAVTALIAIWLLLYAVGYRIGEVGN